MTTATEAAKSLESFAADAQKSMSAQMEKMSKSFEEAAAFNQESFDAVVKASNLYVKAAEELNAEFMAFSKQAVEDSMAAAKDLAATSGMLADGGPLGADVGLWHFGWLFSQALTIGGGTGDVQRNIVAERVLGLPHDIDVEANSTWAETRRSRQDR